MRSRQDAQGASGRRLCSSRHSPPRVRLARRDPACRSSRGNSAPATPLAVPLAREGPRRSGGAPACRSRRRAFDASSSGGQIDSAPVRRFRATLLGAGRAPWTGRVKEAARESTNAGDLAARVTGRVRKVLCADVSRRPLGVSRDGTGQFRGVEVTRRATGRVCTWLDFPTRVVRDRAFGEDLFPCVRVALVLPPPTRARAPGALNAPGLETRPRGAWVGGRGRDAARRRASGGGCTFRFRRHSQRTQRRVLSMHPFPARAAPCPAGQGKVVARMRTGEEGKREERGCA